MTNEYDIAIIGGGLTGLSAAYHLSKYGKRVILIEKEKELGGLVSSYHVNHYHIEKYYHHIFRSDRSLSGERLGYMRAGFHSLVEGILKGIEDNGGEVYKMHVDKIIIKNNEVKGIKVDGKFIGCDNVISTVSPLALRKIIDEKIINPLREIQYQGTVCALFALNDRLMDGIYWLNIKADIPIGAVIGHTNFAPLDDYGEYLIYVTSYFQDLNNSLWKMSEGEVINLYLSGLKKLFPSFDKRDVRWWRLARDVDTGPLFVTGFKNKVLPYKTKIDGLYLAGMFSIPNYPERSMNGSIKAGFECAKEVAK